ncbi:hypothetical protein CCM_07562 [Cordyceps militaris CM01]|uniref:Uncharacterized protein n=1 Tax=Cordyceps militaris (strain CM01) TaxID=983644 RepID=G3JQ60_CORMM|nr:uncharacterized protein CCM_07562 [Cordyceps militaris CM01]EGX89311.1 hypothetical protein CCM_07562 [Cordyceps militaris CM01]
MLTAKPFVSPEFSPVSTDYKQHRERCAALLVSWHRFAGTQTPAKRLLTSYFSIISSSHDSRANHNGRVVQFHGYPLVASPSVHSQSRLDHTGSCLFANAPVVPCHSAQTVGRLRVAIKPVGIVSFRCCTCPAEWDMVL